MIFPSVQSFICNVRGHRKISAVNHPGCIQRCMDCKAIVGKSCDACIDIARNLSLRPDERNEPW